MVGRRQRLSRTDWVYYYASRNGLWPGDTAEVAKVNEDVGSVIAYPRGVHLHVQVVGSEVHRGLPAFVRNRNLSSDCRTFPQSLSPASRYIVPRPVRMRAMNSSRVRRLANSYRVASTNSRRCSDYPGVGD